jgi:tetratricopeptide (TPR) repeat protein
VPLRLASLSAVVFGLCLCSGLSAQEQQTETKLSNSQLAEATQADAYFQQHNLVAALPLYEHLAAQVPSSAVYAERLAGCLLSKADNPAEGEDRIALLKRAQSETERAKALGDNSNMLKLLLERFSKDPNGAALSKNEKMRAGEAAFAKGDFDAAIVSYRELAADDPKSYEAPLFVGDMYFRKHDVKRAGEWFQKAIDIDPNRETAYRYWGDTLLADGEKEEALPKFVSAVVAEPYDRKVWAGLRGWAQKTGATLKGPTVPLPKGPEPTPGGKKGDVTITIDASTVKDTKSGSAAWLMYGMSRTLWRQEKFAKQFPNEKEYRHSLAEEADALNSVLLSLKEQNVTDKQLDPSLRDLVEIGKDGMIEPFVLLSDLDQGIARDYAAYRNGHRDLLQAYIEKYLVHPKP